MIEFTHDSVWYGKNMTHQLKTQINENKKDTFLKKSFDRPHTDYN